MKFLILLVAVCAVHTYAFTIRDRADAGRWYESQKYGYETSTLESRRVSCRSLAYSCRITGGIGRACQTYDYRCRRSTHVPTTDVTGYGSWPLNRHMDDVNFAYMQTPEQIFGHPDFHRINVQYAQTLKDMLEGLTSEPVSEKWVLEKVKQTVQKILSAQGHTVDYFNKEMLNRLMGLVEGMKTEEIPSDLLAKIISAMTLNIQHQVPEDCKLPLRARTIAGLVDLVLEELSKGHSHYPVVRSIVKMVVKPSAQYSIDYNIPSMAYQMAYPFYPSNMGIKDLPKTEEMVEILKIVAPIIRREFHIELDQAPYLFENLEPVKDALRNVLLSGEDETLYEKFERLEAYLPQMVDDCRAVSKVQAKQDIAIIVNRLLAKMTRKGDLIAEELQRYTDNRNFWKLTSHVVDIAPRMRNYVLKVLLADNPVVFSNFISKLIVDALDEKHFQTIVNTNVFMQFLDELQMRVVEGLNEMTDVPRAQLVKIVRNAIMKTLQSTVYTGLEPENDYYYQSYKPEYHYKPEYYYQSEFQHYPITY